MCLKHVKKIFSDTGSIAQKLTLFYAVSTFILITIIALFLYSAMVNILYQADNQFLCGEIAVIKNILKTKGNNTAALQQEVEDIPGSLKTSVYPYYARILDKNNRVVAETQKMNFIFKESTFFNNGSSSVTCQHQWWKTEADKSYLLMQSVVNHENNAWTVQVALDTTYQQGVITQYRMTVILVLLGGALLSILLGYFLSRRGMKRLYELTETTKKITTNSLQSRVDPQSWPAELHELVLAYNKMLDRIEASVSRLVSFSDDLAHELRSPISNLMGEAEVVLSRASSIEEYKNVIESGLEELNRINQIVENLLFLARAENPQIALEKSLLNVREEINVVCRFYQAVLDEKNIKILLEGDAALHANSVMFRRMISNLLSNAIKYSKNNSVIHFKINELDGNNVQVTIVDQGVGISPEHLPKIFQRFYRIDASRTQDTGGTGLGLAIVKSIVELHGGTISVTSEINQGTTIRMVLPK